MKHSTLQMLATALVVSLVIQAAPPLSAQREGTTPLFISGHVVNGTAGAGTPQDMTVVLDVFQTGAQPQQRSTKADSTGRFAFADVPGGEGATYTLTAMYLGIGYTVDMSSQNNWGDVRLTVHEATSSLDNISTGANVLLVLAADSGTHTLSLLETVQLVNTGDTTFIPNVSQGSPMDLLRFPLPAGAFELDVQAELPEGQVLQVDRGFALTTPVPPGEHNVLLSYKVPYTGKSADISRVFLKGAGAFRVLVPEKVGKASSRAMVDKGVTTIGTTNYRLLELANISSGALADVVLDGLPQPSVTQRIQSAFPAGSWAMAVPGVLLLALAVLLVLGLRRSAPAQPVTAGSVAQDKSSLVQAIAALDDTFQSGEIEETPYQEQRRNLKTNLLRRAWQEETSHGHEGEPR